MTDGNIRTLRQQAGLSQSDLAALLRVSKNTVARWEREVITPPPYIEAAVKYVIAQMKKPRRTRRGIS